MGQPLRILGSQTGNLYPEILKAAFENSGEGLALAEGGRISYANAAFAKLLGFVAPGELEGRALASLRPTRYPCPLTRNNAGTEITLNNHVCQFVLRHKDGKLSAVESSCSRFQSEGREFLLLTARDVSLRERRRVVRDEDRRFRVIFDAAPMGIVQCDMEGRVLETNPAVQRMLGYSGEELRGMHFRTFTHPDDVEKDVQLFGELVAGTRNSYELELRYLGKGAATGWVRLCVSLIRGIDGKPQFAIGLTEDITERKQAEQRLREAQKMEVVGRLVGGVAHDFNNLLTGIHLYCDLLLTGLEPGSRPHRHAEEIRMAGEQGAALIQQLMAISRQQVVEPRILSLNDIIHNTRNLLARLLGEKFELVTRLATNLGQVKMDPAQVQQILFNLVLNARDAMEQGGKILVETGNGEIRSQDSAVKESCPAVMLTVTDSGCGMTADTLSHLFEPFFTTKASGRGNGLGLATVHNIVSNSGGIIEVESTPGQGTRVRVSLSRVSESQETEKGMSQFSPACGHETVLLLEDNLTVREGAKRILSECGYSVLEAGSGAEAIEISRKHTAPIHLLLADVVMPGMSGREVARQLMADRPELKVLYMSGYEPEGDPASAEVGPVVLFRKPFTGAALLDKLREVLDAGQRKRFKKSGKRKREQS